MTADFGSALASSAHWLMVLATFGLVALCIGVHYEALSRLNQRMPRWRLDPRRRVLAMVCLIFAIHLVEIWIFGAGLYLLMQWTEAGTVAGAEPLVLFDAVYLSATTYSTVGYGDLAPLGPIRFLLGTEAVLGLLLITWSASFTYLEMERFWKTR